MPAVTPLVLAAMAVTAPPGEDRAPAPALHDISIGLPALDGLRGLQVQYERWLPRPRLGLAVSAQFREAATGDYTSLVGGIGAEVRWYWRADAWLSKQPAGSMVGWFLGGRVDVVLEHTHDDLDDRGIGSTLELGVTTRVGYRIAPWRGLEITPSLGPTGRIDFALSSRTPIWTRLGIGVGLSLGWML